MCIVYIFVTGLFVFLINKALLHCRIVARRDSVGAASRDSALIGETNYRRRINEIHYHLTDKRANLRKPIDTSTLDSVDIENILL